MATKTLTEEQRNHLESQMNEIEEQKKALKKKENEIVKQLQKDVVIQVRDLIKTYGITGTQLKGVIKTRKSPKKKSGAKSEETAE